MIKLRSCRNWPKVHGTLLCLGLWILASPLAAATPGEEVVVVYNKNLPESRELAFYYAEKRGVPTNQILGYELSTKEDIGRRDFRDELQTPLAKDLAARNLWRIASTIVPATSNEAARVEWKVTQSRIRYAVLCFGIPLRITKEPSLKEAVPENSPPEFTRNEAAVDNELALLPLVETNPILAGPFRNPLHATTNAGWLHPTNGILLVARLDGPNVAIARGLIDKALEAEANGFWGRGYFDIRNVSDPNYKKGDDWIRDAAQLSRYLGFEAALDTNGPTFKPSFPMSQIGIYAGWYDEHVSGPFTRPTVEFMPGAFAYHIHSFSAVSVRTATRHWVGPLLAKGATITMGSVDEPYLSGTPDVVVFIARLVLQGFSFGEAAYSAQSVLSWQTTVVGDPLYRPYGKHPETLHQQLEGTGHKNLEWSYLRLANLNLANEKPVADWVLFLEELPLTKKSSILSEKLADLYSVQGKPSSAVHLYNQALKLNPTPQQRIRLMLNLGEKLAPLEPQEAYNIYQQLLAQKDYSDKLDLYRKLLPLAKKLGKQADAEKYQAELDKLQASP